MTRWQREGRLTIRRAHAKDVRVTGQDFIVNALGPSRRPHALVEQLIAEGSARSGPLGFGLHATSTGALIDAHENTSATLFTLGPLLKGELWETTAIPEIREQAHALAQRLGLAQSIR